MKLIHVIPEGENLCPLYSVESIAVDDPHNCWTQHRLTPSKWAARLEYFEAWLRGRGNYKRRIRVL